MAGTIYAFLSLISLLIWYNDPQTMCMVDACIEIPGFYGRSWFIWGAVYYATAAVLILDSIKKKVVLPFLIGGTTFHLGLIGYGYFLTSTICPSCLKLAIVEVLLIMIYLISAKPPRETINRVIYIASSMILFLAIGVCLVNPSPKLMPNSFITKTASSQTINQVNTRTIMDSVPVIKLKSPYYQAYTPEGKEVYLDLNQRPALVFASRCAYCDQVLKEIAKSPEKPYFVAAYSQKNDGEKIQEKLAKNGLNKNDYFLMENPPSELKSVPVILRGEGGK